MLNVLQKRLRGKKAHNKAVFCSANRFGRAAAEKRRDPDFKPQGNSIIPKRKFVMTFQKRRARRGAPFCARRYAKAMSKKRHDRVYAGRGKWRGGAAQAVRRRFARPFGGALAPLGSPPGRLALSNYLGAGFLPRLFFLTAARKPGRGAGAFAAAQGYIIICAYKFVMTFCIFKKIY